MSKYTTEVRFICETEYGLTKSVGYKSVNEILTTVAPKIFDFDFPIFDEEYRLTLETKILKHFYTREIGAETYGLWKLWLDRKLNEIMPYYNKLYKSELLEFNPLYTHNLTRKVDDTTRLDGTTHSAGHDGNIHKYSDTPQGALDNVENGTYLTNASQDTNHHDNTITQDDTNIKDYLETVVGYEGKDASEMLMKYRKTFLNIDMQIINELEPLFMQLW